MLPASEPWGATELILLFVTWTVMMVGMMTPSVAPMILIYARAGRVAAADAKPFAAAGWFASGYLLVWTGFAAAATAAQWVLERFALLDATMGSASNYLGGAILILAGLYQWTPLKHACLSECQAPLQFIRRQGGLRSDRAGAAGMGQTRVYCVGCCWALMLLLFVGGVMNVLWIAVLAIFALLEKIVPAYRAISWLVGTILVMAGLYVLLK
jgi:predicted metal-binding membrane protein